MRRFWTEEEASQLLKLKEQDKLTWPEIARAMGRSMASVRKKYKALRVNQALHLAQRSDEAIINSELSSLLRFLRKPRSTTEISEFLDRSERTVRELIQKLKANGYNLKEFEDGKVLFTPEPMERESAKEEKAGAVRKLKLAIAADLHFGSTKACYDELSDFIHYAEQEKVDKLLICGDILAGVKVYKGQEIELEAWGADRQLELLEQRFPKTAIPISFITGNHDLIYLKEVGKDLGPEIAEVLGGEYLGPVEATLMLTDVCSLRLFHPSVKGGRAYALSYRSQKLADSYIGGDKPRILIIGHYHFALWLPNYRNIQILHAGCFEEQTLWLKSMGLQPQIGGYIVDIEFDEDGSIKLFRPCWVAYYKKQRIAG